MVILPLKLSVEEQNRLGILAFLTVLAVASMKKFDAGVENVQVRLQLGKALVAGLVEAKDTLDGVKDVLDLATDAGLLILKLSEPVSIGGFVLGILAVRLLLVSPVIHLGQMRDSLHVPVLVNGTVGRIAIGDIIILSDKNMLPPHYPRHWPL